MTDCLSFSFAQLVKIDIHWGSGPAKVDLAILNPKRMKLQSEILGFKNATYVVAVRQGMYK